MAPLFIFVLFGVFSFSHSQGSFENDEIRLHKHLLNNSEDRIYIRPVFNTSETMKVNYGLALIQIFELDEEQQVLDLQVWHRFLWKDISLQWNPADFGGIDHTRLPFHKIWRPDIILYNSAFDKYNSMGLGEQVDAMAVVSSDGTVLWIPVGRTRSTCSIDIRHFPYDTQTCVLKIGSWTYDGFKVDIDFYDGLEEIDVSDYIQSNMWSLIGHPAVKNVKYYPCCVEPYPDLTFTLRLKRSPSFYIYTLVTPGVIMTLLIPVIFLLPVGRPEKFTLGCTILVCITLLNLLIEMQVPTAHSGIALINVLFVFNAMFAAMSLVLSAVILTISKFKKDPPYCLKKVVDLLGKICCLETSGAEYQNFRVSMNSGSGETNPIVVDPDTNNLVSVHPDWLAVATVLDRLFLVVFVAFLVIGAISILG